MNEKTYLPVNWADGMKLNKSHFTADQNAALYGSAQGTAALLNDHNYGLLPAQRNGGSSVKIFVSIDNQQSVRLRLLQCKAITRGGYVIDINEDTGLHATSFAAPRLELSVPFGELKEKASQFYAVLSLNPYDRVIYGDADADEQPPRVPFTMPSFDLSLLPVHETTPNAIGLYQLTVGKLVVDEQKVSLDAHYIPPCSSVNSSFDLIEILGSLEQFYSRMELYSLQIIQKIFQKKQANDMADIIRALCERITVLTATQLTEIKSLSLHQPPVYVVSKPVTMARLLKNTLDHYIGSGKEELVNYFNDWCGINQGELEGAVTELANHEYNHLNANASIEKIISFTRTVSQLFAALAKLDYIGKRRDAGVFVKEQALTNQPETPAKKRSSFLAD